MNSLWDTLDRLRSLFFEALSKIENSSQYEQLLNKYEALTPEQQKYIRLGSRLSFIVLMLYLVTSPLMSLFQHKSVLTQQRTLLAEMKTFNMALETRPRPAPPPRDWQDLPANTSTEANNSLRSYISSIGFPAGSYQILLSSNGHIQIDFPEINLRQVQALVHQVDGWYPTLQSQVLDVKVFPEDPQKLTLSMTIAHESGQGASATPPPRPRDTDERRAQPRNVVSPTPPPPPAARFDDDFDNSAITNQRPSNPTLNDRPSRSNDDFPDFDSDFDKGFDNGFDDDSYDSLPPPPPLDDEDF
jgi:hypothetical protein